jgi:hypothetical protein
MCHHQGLGLSQQAVKIRAKHLQPTSAILESAQGTKALSELSLVLAVLGLFLQPGSQ